MNNFIFNPQGGLTDKTAFPTVPASEEEARGQIQEPLNQLRDFINQIVVGFFNDGGNIGGDVSIIGNKIMDSGSNTNGNYIKFYDGTLICYNSMSAVTGAGGLTATGSVYQLTYTFTFPVPFVGNIPVVIPNGTSSGHTWGGSNTPSLTGVGIRVFASQQYTNTTINYMYVAIGKWK